MITKRQFSSGVFILFMIMFYFSAVIYAKEKLLLEEYNVKEANVKRAVESAMRQRKKIIKTAKQLLNSPYKSNGTSPKGFDCSGYTQYVFKKVGIELPHGSGAQAKLGKKIKLKKAKPGDLVFFCSSKRKKRINHVAIVYSNEKGHLKIIHSTSSAGVIIDEEDSYSWKGYWGERLLYARRIID